MTVVATCGTIMCKKTTKMGGRKKDKEAKMKNTKTIK